MLSLFFWLDLLEILSNKTICNQFINLECNHIYNLAYIN